MRVDRNRLEKFAKAINHDRLLILSLMEDDKDRHHREIADGLKGFVHGDRCRTAGNVRALLDLGLIEKVGDREGMLTFRIEPTGREFLAAARQLAIIS